MPGTVVAGLAEQRAATLRQLGGLDGGDWTALCLPPWRVRDVVAHLVTVDEAVVTGRILRVLRRGGPDALERWNDTAVLRLAGLEPAELRERLERWGARVCAVARALPPPVDRVRLRTAYGRLSPRDLLCLRATDEWVHTVDVAGVTGVAADLPATVPPLLAGGVLPTFPALVLPRVRRPVGVLRLVVGAGARGDWHGDTLAWGVDFARRQYGPRVTWTPDATVHLHASTLALLAWRRLSWREALPGTLVVEGDGEVAAGLLDAIGNQARGPEAHAGDPEAHAGEQRSR